MRDRFAPALLAVLLAAPTARADAPGFAFLQVPAGARAAAMGGAYVALADGIDGAFWNPAALAGVRGTQIAGGHVEFIQSLNHEQFALAGRHLGGGVAASLRAMYTMPIDARDDRGALTGSFGSHDLEFQLAYGRELPGALRVGLGAQAVRERIDDVAATTWSNSAGAAWRVPVPADLRLGASVLHVGPVARYSIDGAPGAPVELPASLQAGAAWTRALAHGFTLTAALDARATRGRDRVLALGAELASDAGACVRVGGRDGDDLTALGAGLGYRRGTFTVDYAWVPSRLELGDTHRFSFGAQF